METGTCAMLHLADTSWPAFYLEVWANKTLKKNNTPNCSPGIQRLFCKRPVHEVCRPATANACTYFRREEPGVTGNSAGEQRYVWWAIGCSTLIDPCSLPKYVQSYQKFVRGPPHHQPPTETMLQVAADGRRVRFMIVADVAIGNPFVTTETNFQDMTRPPHGYDSIVGKVRNTIKRCRGC